MGGYKDKDKSLDANLGILRISLWLLYVVSELLFIDQVKIPRYLEALGQWRL